MATKLYIFDLDGTLANVSHRVCYVNSKKHKDRNYKKFFEACVDDTPNQWVVDLLEIVRHHGDVLILSGRSDLVETETREWLSKYKVLYDYLVMRKEGDYTPDYKLKKEMLEGFLRDKDYEVQFIVDDRQSVVDMWRKEGYNVLQCNAWSEQN